MDKIIFDSYNKRDIFNYLTPGSLFIADRNFVRYMRCEKVKNKYYKFSTNELDKMSISDINKNPILLYLGHTLRGDRRYEEHIFLYKKEKLFLYNDDLDYFHINIKIISQPIDK